MKNVKFPQARIWIFSVRRPRMVPTQVSRASMSAFSSADPGTGARAAGALSCPGSHVEHLDIAISVTLQSSGVMSEIFEIRFVSTPGL
jgi:hypothetical protein